MSVATKLMVVTYCQVLPYINLYDTLIIRSCEVTCQMKYVVSPFAEDSWASN